MADARIAKSQWIVGLTVGALSVAIFAPALRGRYGFVYRDAAHFYHPLFALVRATWAAGRVPLWNPYENLGMPLAGDATSSVFYPGKLLFALPLDYTLLLNMFVVAHVVLAAYTSYRLARHFGVGVLGAGLAAVSYAFSGNVLFQYCNVVFLIGAAWLPLALELADRMLRQGSSRAAIGLGVVLALIVTGGDPQMAVNAGLLAVLDAVILWRAARQSPAPPLLRSVGLLATAAALGLLLSAVQILPCWQATQHSLRSAHAAPRNVYELAATPFSPATERTGASTWYAGLLGAADDEHTQQIYQFNVGPWRAIEFVWPNVSGRHFPINSRWLDVLPAEGRVWTPSLYMGLLPFVLAVATFSIRRKAPPGVRWLSWMTLLGALAGLGVYGLVWWAREVGGWFGVSIGGNVGDEVGGVYWLMTVVLPGYVYFRYPAKLLVITSLGLSVLAAIGWDKLWSSEAARCWRFFQLLAIVSIFMLGLLLPQWPRVCDVLAGIRPNELFGPFDCQVARIAVHNALLQTSVVAWLFMMLLDPRIRHRRFPAVRTRSDLATAIGSALRIPNAPAPRGSIRIVCLLLTAAELAIAQRPLVPYAPAALWQTPASSLDHVRTGDSAVRFYRDPLCWNDTWRTTSSPRRLQESLAWERATMHPKYNLTYQTPLVETPGTLTPYDVHVLWEVAREHAEAPSGLPPAHLLRLLGVLKAIVPTKLAPHDSAVASGVALVDVANPLPRAWIVHEVHVLSELADNSPAGVKQRTEEVLFPTDHPRDWSREAVVETNAELPEFAKPAADGAAETCNVVSAEPQRVEIDVQLASAGLVVLADAYDPGWTLTVETDGTSRDMPLLRTNRVLRGAMLPAGRHRLVYRYQPLAFAWGAAISVISLLGLISLPGVSARRNMSRKST